MKTKILIITALCFSIVGLCSAQTSSPTSSSKTPARSSSPASGISSPTALTTTTAATTASGSIAPYTEGPVWELTMVRTKPGMTDDYLKNLANAYKSTSEEAKKQGIIVDYKILIGDAVNRDDYDILLLLEYKNMAAFDGLRDRTDPIARKLIGSEDQMREASVKRMEIREILGTKTMREITLK
jgi:hypothetical protein